MKKYEKYEKLMFFKNYCIKFIEFLEITNFV